MGSRTKVRCPSCGAKNDADARRCRICGTDVSPGAEEPMTAPRPGTAQVGRAGLGRVVLIAFVVILGLLVAAILLGAVEGPRWLNNAVNEIPFLDREADDGWTTQTEEAAGWQAEMPVERARGTTPFPGADSGTAELWLAEFGGTATVPDTELSVIWSTVPFPEGENVEASLATTAEQWAAQLGGRVTENDEATYAGLPARRLKVTGLDQGDEAATVDALLIRRRDQLFVLQSLSIYPDHPQFGRLVEGFELL
ncbi:MAG: zinc-ribbon domain-containing protein [Acidimicrobiales bacterium]|jgi:hypothetical protein|nr:zinc-ribbon domain-containing protein [Acidimicrobiales bacterium]